jgi:hypothetical protein
MPKLKSVRHWIKINKKICLKRVINMDNERIRASTKEVIDPFFDLLEKNYNDRQYRKELIVSLFFY